ncbi:hypothetical protein [Gulosibacter faecalis]|uniref:Protein kinase domain-containing protein n=1 Tax=Gulosibacter faecalis TaxID=272240 RepID=A0ABW5UYV8_9MICO|nr:hypothetical protein [Gulosibacter faecalis]
MRSKQQMALGRPPSVGDVVAGWRLVRPLPEEIPGVASFVAVAEAGGRRSGSEHWHHFASEEPASLRHLRVNVAVDEEARSRISRDAAARHRHGGDFVRPRLELLTDDAYRITVSELVRDTSFSALVTARVSLAPGAVVTLLVPLLETVIRAHESGLTHGSLTLQCCRIDDRGRPWFDDWSGSVDLEELTTMRRDFAVQEELRAVGRICDAVHALSTTPGEGQVAPLIAALSSGAPVADALPRLVDALFAWATPAAVPIMNQAKPSAALDPSISSQVARGSRPTAPDVGATAGDEEDLLGAAIDSQPRRRRARGETGGLALQFRILATHAAAVRPAAWLGLVGAGAVGAVLAPLL